MTGEASQEKPISLFFSYSHKDEALRDELGDHLVPLGRAGLIEVWHDREMLPGDNVDDEIAEKLKTADIILILVSPSFIRSSYCYDIELEKAIERHKKGKARVVPIILRPCQWDLTPLKGLLAMPTDGRPVIEWPNNDTAFNDVAVGIRKLALAIRENGISVAGPAAAGAKPGVGQTAEVQVEATGRPPGAPHSGSGAVEDERPAQQRGEQGEARQAAGAEARRPPRPADGIENFASFRDINAPWCPEMVALPAGEFLMGSAENEKERYADEGPRHRVNTGRRFAIGRSAVTFAEYDWFCGDTNRNKPDDEGWGRGRRPVINVKWSDAKAYAEWLTKMTRKPYRLPSEAEWEYAARAGTTTRYAFGDVITPKDANYGSNVGTTTEVGAYHPNAWGLCDMHGNVWEWVEDLWHDNYEGAPNDGLAWTDGGGDSSQPRVARGGSWDVYPRSLRSAARGEYHPWWRISYLVFGFRVARALDVKGRSRWRNFFGMDEPWLISSSTPASLHHGFSEIGAKVFRERCCPASPLSSRPVAQHTCADGRLLP